VAHVSARAGAHCWPRTFFTTEVWTVRGLVTYCTLFVIELHTRRVHVLGSTPYPDEAFVIQTMRQLTDHREIGQYNRDPSNGREYGLAVVASALRNTYAARRS
jgi:hypothetical protein